MDLMAEVLAGVHSHEAVLHRSVLAVPYGLHVDERSPLTVIVVLDGPAWVELGDGQRHQLGCGIVHLVTGDLAGAEPYLLTDAPGSPVRYRIDRSGAARVDGEPLPPPTDQVRCLVEPIEPGEPSATVISGNYSLSAGLGRLVRNGLPPLASVRVPETSALISLLEAELDSGRPGQQAVLDRWLDLLLATAIRSWFTDERTGPAWCLARTDPQVGPALAAMHRAPQQRWTVASLARQAGSSRSAFSARFSDLLGQAPMSYLTELRMDLAVDLLRRDDASLSAVAQAVGYADQFGFSAAFKRHRGLSPSMVRRRTAG
ncbi:MAG: AraC family transcriptional regulator [Beutenbergiaceae bacterium]